METSNILTLIKNERWRLLLELFFKNKNEFIQQFTKWLQEEYKTYTIFPPTSQIFEMLHLTNFNDVKVVIIGQYPYHNYNQAHGLAFSSKIDTPPSLINIFKELNRTNYNGDLTLWAKQGVLLLNESLTVRYKIPNSHKGKGWSEITNGIIQILNKKHNHLVFLLWGQSAQQKYKLIDKTNHLVLIDRHPSPLTTGFVGCNCFINANNYLEFINY